MRRIKKRTLVAIVIITAILFLIYFVWSDFYFGIDNQSDLFLERSPIVDGSEESFLVRYVIDGDTIVLESGRYVRYIGIDSPETVHEKQPEQCFSKEALNKNMELVLNKRVTLKKDLSEKDKYGRLLRYVYVDGVFVNDFLVRNGYAYATSYSPDIRYQDEFREAEQIAKENKAGLWGSCK